MKKLLFFRCVMADCNEFGQYPPSHDAERRNEVHKEGHTTEPPAATQNPSPTSQWCRIFTPSSLQL